MRDSTKLPTTLVAIEDSLRKKIKIYKKRATEMEIYLKNHPDEWGAFQDEFNLEVNRVFVDIMNFEKFNFSNGQEEKVFKLKQFFVKRFRKIFRRGEYGPWSIDKPFGYAGDFKIIDNIYKNTSNTNGFDRLFDNYFQMSAVSVAVRNRKEDFKGLINRFAVDKTDRKLRIMNLACGSCRELKEMLDSDLALYKNVTFDCYDHDERAIEYAKNLLVGNPNINFIKENAIRIAFRKNIFSLIDNKYDLIYSTGLFDYFSERVSIAVVTNLKKLLNPDGVLVISTMRDKYSNPSVHYMEWAGDWPLIYRTDIQFKAIFFEAGFHPQAIKTLYEKQKIMQYILAMKEVGK